MEESLQIKIQQYVNGELKGDALRAFELDLRNNPDLQQEVKFSRDMVDTIKNKKALGVHQMFEGIMDEMDIEPDFEGLKEYETPSSPNWTAWLIGVTAAIAISVALLIKMSSVPSLYPDNEIIATYLTPYENIISTNGRAAAQLEQGMQAYTNGNYKAASLQLSDYLNNSQDSPVQLYLGISQLLSGDNELAANTLEEVLQVGDLPEPNVAEWYLALSYLSLDRVGEARSLLENLQSDGQFGTQAQAILSQLKQEG